MHGARQAGAAAAHEQTAQLVANMEAASREAKAKAAAASKLGETVQAGKAVWGSETPDNIQLDQVSPSCLAHFCACRVARLTLNRCATCGDQAVSHMGI